MGDVISVKVDTAPIDELVKVMRDYEVLAKKTAAESLAKGAREVTFALNQEFRKQPPRPVEGSISRQAFFRNWKMNTLSRSYLSGFTSALKTLGGNKSGYFRKMDVNGRVVVTPIVLGKKRQVILAGRKHVNQRGSLLTSRKELKNGDAQLPENWVRLNATALAVVRALNIRERAALGGFMGAQFLTFRNMQKGPRIQRVTFLAKNNNNIGEVIPETDNDGNLESVTINGRVPNTAKVANRLGIIPRALSEAAKSYREDMNVLLAKRLERRLAEAKKQ